MKILLLVNWKIQYGEKACEDYLPSDWCYDDKFWFFRKFVGDVHVDVVDTRSIKWIEKIEKDILRMYVVQTLRVLGKLNKYDLIISHGTPSGIFLAFLHRLFRLKMPPHIVVDISSFHRASTSGLVFNLCKFASKRFDYLIYHTPCQEKYFKKHFPWLSDNCSYVTFGEDYEYWKRMADKVREEGRETEERYFVCVGYRKRDWKTLIKAFHNSSQKYKLILIGNTDIRTKNDNIITMPFMPINELVRYIIHGLFCVLPLEYYEYSYGQMTLLQQMALGKMVIVADVPSVAMYKSEGVIRYDYGDAEQLCDLIDYYSDNQDLVDWLGEQNRIEMMKKYSVTNMAAEFEEICDRIMENKVSEMNSGLH